jgi:hypothetical protein
LQLCLGLFAFRSAADGRTNIDDADFAGCGRASSSRGLGPHEYGAHKASNGQGRRRNYHSGIHFILLVVVRSGKRKHTGAKLAWLETLLGFPSGFREHITNVKV